MKILRESEFIIEVNVPPLNASVNLPEGGVVAIIGPNNSGKSFFLKISYFITSLTIIGMLTSIADVSINGLKLKNGLEYFAEPPLEGRGKVRLRHKLGEVYLEVTFKGKETNVVNFEISEKIKEALKVATQKVLPAELWDWVKPLIEEFVRDAPRYLPYMLAAPSFPIIYAPIDRIYLVKIKDDVLKEINAKILVSALTNTVFSMRLDKLPFLLAIKDCKTPKNFYSTGLVSTTSLCCLKEGKAEVVLIDDADLNLHPPQQLRLAECLWNMEKSMIMTVSSDIFVTKLAHLYNKTGRPLRLYLMKDGETRELKIIDGEVEEIETVAKAIEELVQEVNQ